MVINLKVTVYECLNLFDVLQSDQIRLVRLRAPKLKVNISMIADINTSIAILEVNNDLKIEIHMLDFLP